MGPVVGPSAMGVRPPQDDADDEPTTVTFGIAALDARMDETDLAFPADRDEVVDALGDPDIPYDASGSAVPLSTALEETGTDSFESEQDFLNALHPIFETYRENAGAGLFAQLRSMLPF